MGVFALVLFMPVSNLSAQFSGGALGLRLLAY